MTNRVISYVFRGDFSSLNSGMVGATRNSKELSTSLKEAEVAGTKTGKGMTVLGAGLGGLAVGGVAAIGAIEKSTMGFDKAMSAVQAATHATAAEMASFRSAALDASKTTAFSASEAAGAIEALAKAGVSTKDILGGGLTGALNLAAAGTMDVSAAAEAAASAMTQFHLSGAQVGHVADLLSAGAGKAQGSVEDLGMALNQSGLVAAQTGLSIEETTGTLAAFASAGLIGSDAGTSFKTMLQALTPNSKQAREAMDKLGISAYDSQGNFIGMAKFAGVLRKALSGLSAEQRNAALKTIFGSDAVRAASVIYADGADGIQKWINKTNDAGYAAETAAARLDNLSGDLGKLRNALEAQAIQSGEGSQSFLRDLTQTATELVNISGGKLPFVHKSLEQLGQDQVKNALGLNLASGALDFWSKKLGISTDETKKSSGASKDSTSATDQMAAALVSMGGDAQQAGQDLDSLVKAMKDQKSAAVSAFDAQTQYGEAMKAAADAAKKGKRGIDASTAAGRENRQALSQLASAWNGLSDTVRNTPGKYAAAKRNFIDMATKMGVSEGAARRLARQLLNVPNKVVATVSVETGQAEGAIAHINDRLDALNGKVAHTYIVTQTSLNSKRAGIAKADGGPIYGPGTATSDSIPAMLSNGEYVVKASAVAKYGTHMMDAINRERFANGGLVGRYASGGAVIAAGAFGIEIDKKDGLKKRLDLFSKALDKATKSLDDEKQARDALRGSISSGLSGDLFSSSGNSSAFSGQFAAGSVADANARLRQQIHDAQQFAAIEKQLRARGLSGPALQEVIASGDTSTACVPSLRPATANCTTSRRSTGSGRVQWQRRPTRAPTSSG